MLYNVTMIFKNGKQEKFMVFKDSFLEFCCFLISVVSAFEKDFDSELSNIVMSCIKDKED